MRRISLNSIFIAIFVIFNQESVAQTITTFAGCGIGSGGFSGDGGPATAAHIDAPGGSAFDKDGNFYFAIRATNRIRRVSTLGIITTVAGNGIAGYSGDDVAATSTQINEPLDVAIDTGGNLYIADYYNARIRKVDKVSGIITTVAGTGIIGFSGDGGPATLASLNYPNYICFDRSNNLFITDWGNNRVRKVNASGIISTVAGNGGHGFTCDGGLADTTTLNGVYGITTDTAGNLFMADAGNYRIRKVDAISGIITTAVGNGIGIYNGEGVSALLAGINVWDNKFDSHGNMYIADYSNQRARKIDVSGNVYTVAGIGTSGFSGDGGPATNAQVYDPEAVSIDPCGNLYISDVQNERVRKVTFPGTIIPPTISISAAPGDTICAGTTVTFTSTVTTGGTLPVYQWYVNGTSTGTSSSYSYIPDNGDIVMCILTSSSPCASIPDTTSNVITMVVNPVVTPVIAITASPGDTVCAGTSVTFTSSISGGGTSPAYQWYVNGLSAGTSSTYTYVPVDGDVVKCELTTSSPCARIPDTTSNVITMVVNPVFTPVISITASPGDSVCAGTSVTFTSSISGGGTSPVYQWYVNGLSAGTSSMYSYVPLDGDVVECKLTTSGPCARIPDTTSNVITMAVNPVVTPVITITASPGDTVCAGTSVTFTSSISGGGSFPAYQWFLNGSPVGASSSYTYTPGNSDMIKCELTSSGPCARIPDTTSNVITMVVNPVITPVITLSGLASYTLGSTVTVTATITGTGSYLIRWMNDGVEFATTTTPVVTYTKTAGTDTITAMVVPTAAVCLDSTLSLPEYVSVNSTGITNVDPTTEVSVLPNPAQTVITIVSPVRITDVVIRNMPGQTVLDQPGMGRQMDVNISGLPPGLYVVRVTDAQGNKTVKKIVKE